MLLRLLIAVGRGVQPFQPFGFHLLLHLFVVLPGKAHARRFGIDAVGLDQRRQAGGQAGKKPLRLSFGVLVLGALDLLPGGQLGIAAVKGDVAENVRVAAYHFGPVGVQGVVQAELALAFV